MSMLNVGAGAKAATQPLKGGIAAVVASVTATPESTQPVKDARSLKTQTERFDTAPDVDLQAIELPIDVAGNTGMSTTSTGGPSGGRRADASDALPEEAIVHQFAENTTMSTTSTGGGSPQPRPRPAPGSGVKAQAASA